MTGERQERPDPEVPEKARRRTFTAHYKLDVVAEYDAAGGRREGRGAAPGRPVLQPHDRVAPGPGRRHAGRPAGPRGRPAADPRMRREPGTACAGHTSRCRQAGAGGRRAEPGLFVGHHQAARPGEMDVLPPVCDLGHLLPVRGRLDGRHPRVRRPGREAHRGDLRQAGASPAASSPFTPTGAPR